MTRKCELLQQDNDKPKGNNVASPSVINIVEHNNSSRYHDNKGKRKHHDNTRVDPNKKVKPTCWNMAKLVTLKGIAKVLMLATKPMVYYVTYVFEAYFVQDDDVAWWVDLGATVHVSFMSTSKLNDSILWHARLGHVRVKRMQDMSKDGLILAFDMYTKKSTPSLENKKYFLIFIDDASRFCYVYLLHIKDEALDKFKVFKTEVELQQWSLIKRFRTYREAFRFFIIEPNDSVSINSIIESRDAIFDENRFSLVPRQSMRSLRTEDIGGSVVPEEVTEKVVQQPELELRKSKRNRTLNNFGPEFQLFLIEGTMDEVSDQHSYCFNVEDDLKTFDEAMKSQDVTFWKEAINDEMDSIMDGTIKKFKARLVIQGFKQKSGIDYFDTYAPVARISTIRLLTAMTSIHNLIFNQMDVKTTFLNGELEEEELYKAQTLHLWGVKLEPVLEGYTNASWISNTEDNSSISGWVFLLSGGTISWASKKQTCITGSTMEYEFIALVAAGKEAEWLKNLLFEIPLWSKPIAPISIRCDSAVTLAKPYSQMYNGKSRHLGVRHSMIRELITNGMVFIEFVRSQQNLADHLTKELARDLVIKSAEGMRLKSN
ncbi:zinc finger, CCHC-type containing protein [Tanacetum coccineum]